MVTRRQFGLWAVAAMVVAPSVGIAGQARKEESILEGIALTAKLLEKSESVLAIDLQAVNSGKKGVTVRFHVVSATIEFDGENVNDVMVWMNDQSPMSRRMRPPSFVDLPSDKPILAGKVNIWLPEGWEEKSNGVVKLVLGIRDDTDALREIELPPIHLTEPSQENS